MQIETADSMSSNDRINDHVQLGYPLPQRTAQRARQPEHPAVVVETNG